MSLRNLKFYKFCKNKKYLLVGALGIFIVLISSYLLHDFIPPADIPDELELLYLNESAYLDPTFRMQAQQTYHLETGFPPPQINQPKSMSSELSPTYAAAPAPSELSPTYAAALAPSDLSPTHAAALASSELSPAYTAALAPSELSPAYTAALASSELSPLHIMAEVDSTSKITPELVSTLTLLNQSFSSVTLSLIPKAIDEQSYIAFCNELYELLKSNHLDKVTLIGYPQDMKNLNLYDSGLFANIGVVVENSDDISILDQVYKHFASTATLYIRDNIAHYCNNDVTKATQEINHLYYLLAAKYPKITTIFSPYMKNNLFPTDEYYLDTSSNGYPILSALYEKLILKPWLTTSTEENISTISYYQPLDSYTEVSGKLELILSPTANIFDALPFSYLEYKINGNYIAIQHTYPYLIHLDTTEHPNGISRLKLSSYKENNQLIKSQCLDIKINNPLTETRASRIDTTYSINSKPIYNSNYIPILMYHSVLDTVSEEEQNSCVEIDVFESQIKALLEAGYTPINFKTLKDYLNQTSGLPEKPILITMDDGYLNNYENAYPIYQKYNIEATLFVSPYYMSDENTERHFGWNAAREMEASGLIDIQSHGYDHTPFSYISLKDLQYHISHSFGLIEKNLGPRDVFTIAYPQFRNTSSTRKLLASQNIDFQITNLAWVGTGLTQLTPSNLKRINVPNNISPEELVKKIAALTR